MDECEFYRVERKVLRSKEIRADRQGRDQVMKTPWCDHPNHSPVSKKDTRVLGGGNLLKCGGDCANCPLTPEQFTDI